MLGQMFGGEEKPKRKNGIVNNKNVQMFVLEGEKKELTRVHIFHWYKCFALVLK